MHLSVGEKVVHLVDGQKQRLQLPIGEVSARDGFVLQQLHRHVDRYRLAEFGHVSLHLAEGLRLESAKVKHVSYMLRVG